MNGIESLGSAAGVGAAVWLLVGAVKKFTPVVGLGLAFIALVLSAFISILGGMHFHLPFEQVAWNALMAWVGAMGMQHAAQTTKEHLGKR